MAKVENCDKSRDGTDPGGWRVVGEVAMLSSVSVRFFYYPFSFPGNIPDLKCLYVLYNYIPKGNTNAGVEVFLFLPPARRNYCLAE